MKKYCNKISVLGEFISLCQTDPSASQPSESDKVEAFFEQIENVGIVLKHQLL